MKVIIFVAHTLDHLFVILTTDIDKKKNTTNYSKFKLQFNFVLDRFFSLLKVTTKY